MAHPRDSLTPRRINTLLFEESDRDREFSGFDTNGASNIQGISENIDDNPDDPQPITSGVATPVLGPSTSGVASVATSDPRPSTSGVASVATEDPRPSTSGVASITHRQLRKRKLSFSRCFRSDSESDVSDDEIDFMPVEDSSSDSDVHCSPVKRTYRRRYLRSGSVPYAIPKGRGRSRSKTPATDSESDHEGEYAGMEEVVVGGMVPGPHGAVGGQTKVRPAPPQPCAASTLLPPPPAPPRPMPQVHPAPCDREWNWTQSIFVPQPCDFDASGSGIQPECPITNESTELDYFQLYFDEPIMNLIVTQTNFYYQYVMNNTTEVGESSWLHRWKDTTVAEMYLFLATVMLMPHIYKNNIRNYWSTDHFISTPVFCDLPCNRFTLLLRMLHFADRNMPDRNDLYKIREVFMYLKQKFSVYFYPFKNIVVDESLILFKGCLSFKQYIPSKHNCFGIKLFVMCDCESGPVLDVIVYTGKNTLDDDRRMLGISGDVVRRMMEPYLGKGHTLYTDNWYTSPMLADFLRVNNTDICGTVRRNRKHMPRFTGGSVEGEVQAFHANDIMALTWHDKRDVTLLSTIHRNEMVQTDRLSKFNNEPIVKPLAVVDYTNNMRLVDKCDMMIGFVDCVRRSRKWYIKLFFYLVDIAVLNAFSMYEVWYHTCTFPSTATCHTTTCPPTTASGGSARPNHS
nr:piggyBac transposable element-derived protein 4-like [Cherax quadricarinatus]